MSDFTGLISAEFKQLHIDMITEVIRGSSVICSLVRGNTKFTDCPNCVYDSVNQRSSNRYQSGGPIAFTFGVCPYCHGIGKVPSEQISTISLAPIYDYKHWVPGLAANVQSPYGFVQTLSLFNTYDDLKEAKEIIIDTSINSQVKARFERYQEPQPCGLGSSSFIMTLWKRIENNAS